MGNKSYFALMLSLLLAACGTATPPASQPPSDQPADNSGQESYSGSGAQALVVYYPGDTLRLNEFQATNVTNRKPAFDFIYRADRDETLTLALNTVKPILLGCDNSDIGFEFSLYRVGPDGKIDLSGYEGLGPSPVLVKRGGEYVVRVKLVLDKDCLGISYKFGVEVAPARSQ